MICGNCHSYRTKHVRDINQHWKACRSDQEWGHVVELRRGGHEDAADRVVRKLLGIQGPPMSEEKKEELRAYAEAHKEEITARRRQRKAAQKRTLELLKTAKRRKA